MQAVLYDAFRGAPQICSLDDPTPTEDGVVIQVSATGLCRSDWHGWMGHDPDIQLPHVPGHEFAGVVVEVGRQVTQFHSGDRVTVPFSVGCGRCGPCATQQFQVCDNYFQPGFTAWGSFAELVAIPAADLNLVRLPHAIDFLAAACLGCRYGTSFHALRAQAELQPQEWLAVHGCGGVGLAAIQIGRAMGAHVVAIDVAEPRCSWQGN